MKIILLRERGRTSSFRLSRQTALVAVLALVTVSCLGSYYLVDRLNRPAIGAETIAQWREKLDAQQLEVQAMRDRSAAESQAVGKRLAQMQARLLRMEALGARITEVADLDEGEFSFDQPPAQGGPMVPGSDIPQHSELQGNLEELAQNLLLRENELEVLESMLLDREIEEAREIAGRPVTWGWMSSNYGQRLDPFTGKSAWHAGVDFAGKDGSDVIAVAGGVVTHSGKRYGYGLMVEITHGDGYVTRYGHHAEVLVEAGDIVKRGEVIGKMGSSGRATGPHVHFEVLKNGRHVDPARYVARRR